jgi:type I restriction enzyme S subunit
MNSETDNLPKGWVWIRLDAFAEIILGQSPPSSTYNEDGKGLSFYQGKLEFGDMYPTPRKWCTSPKKIAEKGDVLIAVRAPVGPTNICPERSCIGRGLAAIRGLEGVETHFILYLMRAHENLLSGIGTGTTFNAITGDKLKGVQVSLPPLPEQHRIVAKIEELFTRLDAGVEALKRIKAQLKRYRQSVLKHAFEGKLTQEWRQAHKDELEPASVLLERIKQERQKTAKAKYKELHPLDISDLPQLPEGWVCTALGETVEPSDEKIDPAKAQNMPYIGLEHIEKDNGKLLGYGYANDVRSTKTRFYTGDLLYGRLRPYLNKTHVVDFDGICSTDILVFPSGQYLSNKYLLYRLLCSDFVSFASSNMSGVQHPRVSFSILSRFPLFFPSLPEQHKIAEEIDHYFSVADEIEKTVDHSLRQAERLRHSILKRAFEGKLVPQDPNDEPAEKLLERIRQERVRQQAECKPTKSNRKK